MPRPAPGEGEVLVRVRATGVGPWDGWIRAGKSALPQPLPLTLGSDLTGVVEPIGPGVNAPGPGVEIGVTNKQFTGAHAEYALAAAGMIAPKPGRFDDATAAAIPVVAVTAQQALFEQARLVAGQTVLIHGAGGSVGILAVQLARQAGLRIFATAGARDLDRLQRLGAEEVIDYRAGRFAERASGVDAVIDLVGGEVQARSFAVLKPGGILVSAVSEPDQQTAARHGVRALFFLVDVTTAHLDGIAKLVDAVTSPLARSPSSRSPRPGSPMRCWRASGRSPRARSCCGPARRSFARPRVRDRCGAVLWDSAEVG